MNTDLEELVRFLRLKVLCAQRQADALRAQAEQLDWEAARFQAVLAELTGSGLLIKESE